MPSSRALKQHLRDMQDHALSLLIVFFGYLAVALIGNFLYRVVGTSPYIIVAPIGVSFAAVILEGYVVWPAIALGALVNALVAGSPPYLVVASVLGNTLQPLAGRYLLDTFKFDRLFFSLHDMFVLVIAAMTTTMIVPSINTIAILIADRFGATESAYWVSWWVGGALSALVITPLLIRWIRRNLTHRSPTRYVEITILLAVVAVSSVFAYGTPYTTFMGISLGYPLIVALLWISFRGGVRFTTIALFLLTAISLWGALFGEHPSSLSQSPQQLVFNTQLSDLIIVLFFFIMVSLEEQRHKSERILEAHSEQLELALGRIRMQDDAKNEFIALLGHELRNPLAALLSSVELLQLSELSSHERGELLEAMTVRIRSMAHLLEDILDISRITQRKFVLRKARVSMLGIAERALTATAPLMRAQRHVLRTDFPAEPVIIQADPTRIEQVCINLLHNAAKYTPPGGTIEFGFKRDPDRVLIWVKDSGLGIAEDVQERIFEPFMQVDPASGRAGGIGVGLSITKGLVEMHDGTITVESGGPGQGSEFVVSLPGADEAEMIEVHRPREQKIETLNPSASGLDILVVDDNDLAAHGLGKLLSLRGNRVRVTTTAAAAIKDATAHEPQVILLDIGLPDMDGYGVARTLRDRGNKAIIVALTGFGQDDDKKKTRAAGFDFHLTKPVGLAEVEPILAEIAERQTIQE